MLQAQPNNQIPNGEFFGMRFFVKNNRVKQADYDPPRILKTGNQVLGFWLLDKERATVHSATLRGKKVPIMAYFFQQSSLNSAPTQRP